MYIIGFLHSLIPMMVCFAGITLYTVRREHCRGKFFVCILLTIALQFVICYLSFSDVEGDQRSSLAKILTTLMIGFMIFGGGLCVYGGWARIGIYIFATDIFLGSGDRIYWAVWESMTHRTADPTVIYYSNDAPLAAGWFIAYECFLLIPFVIGGYKLRMRKIRPEWLTKSVTIIYLVMGSTPLVARIGFDDASKTNTPLILLVWIILSFLVAMTVHITAVHERQQILYLKEQVKAEQSRLLMMQKERVRRLRHDVNKHLANLEYILEKDPELRSDPVLLFYLAKLNEDWIKRVFYCDSSVINLCLEQIKRYCDDRGLEVEIVLKRLNFSGWTQEDELTFGTLLLDLLQLANAVKPLKRICYVGDCTMGQNILRITMFSGTVCEQESSGVTAEYGTDSEMIDGQVNRYRNQSNDMKKTRKLISNIEKSVRLILSKYEGKLDRSDNDNQMTYILNWREGNSVLGSGS